MITLLTIAEPTSVVPTSSPIKGPADLQKEQLLEQAAIAAKQAALAAETVDLTDSKMVSKQATPAKNELLHGLTNLTEDDFMGWSDVAAIYPMAEAKMTIGGPGDGRRCLCSL